jgi:hypothetical protein
MATQPKPKPKPEPEPPEPGEDDAATTSPVITGTVIVGDPDKELAKRGLTPPAANHGRAEEPPGITLLERVENLENRMTALEERVAAPPVGLGRRP